MHDHLMAQLAALKALRGHEQAQAQAQARKLDQPQNLLPGNAHA